MLKKFDNFWGHDLRRGCQIIALISAVVSLFLASILFYAASAGHDYIAQEQKKYPSIKGVGGSTGFSVATSNTGIQNCVHLFCCILLYYGTKCDGEWFVRGWIMSVVVWLCFHVVLIPYAGIVLFYAGAYGAGVGFLLGLIPLFPIKLYFFLVVNSYYTALNPGRSWGSDFIADTHHEPRSCQVVPPIVCNQSAVVRIQQI